LEVVKDLIGNLYVLVKEYKLLKIENYILEQKWYIQMMEDMPHFYELLRELLYPLIS